MICAGWGVFALLYGAVGVFGALWVWGEWLHAKQGRETDEDAR